MTEKFEGFPKALTTFLRDLEANNRKDWFDAHRGDYDVYFKESALTFIRVMAPHLQKLDPNLKAEAKLNGSLRRIFRDTRFSNDKTPYTPHLHIIFWEGGKAQRAPGFHLVLGPNKLGIGAGAWGLEGAHLKRYREAVQNPKHADALRQAIAIGETDGGYALDAPALKRVPSGMDVGSPYEDLFRQKALILRCDTSLPPEIFKPEAPNYVIGKFWPLLPLHHWIMTHIFSS